MENKNLNEVKDLNENEVEKVTGGDNQIERRLKDELLKHKPYEKNTRKFLMNISVLVAEEHLLSTILKI